MVYWSTQSLHHSSPCSFPLATDILIINSFDLHPRRQIKCQEETEQNQKVRAREQVEAKVWGKVEAVDRVVVLRQGRAVTAYAQAAVKKQPIKGELPAMTSNALSVALP